MQPFTIGNLAYISFTALKIFELKSTAAHIVVVSVIILHLFFFVSIAFLYCLNREGESTESAEQTSIENSADKPPSYNECVENPPSYEMTQIVQHHPMHE